MRPVVRGSRESGDAVDMMRVKIENVTTSIKLRQSLDIDALETSFGFLETKEGSGMVILHMDGAVSVQLFKNGNIVCTGSRTTADAKSMLADALTKLGITFNPNEIRIRDIMASTIVSHDINLERAYAAFGSSAEYNPEWFVGVIVHLDSLGTTGIAYSNGKVVVSSAKDMDAVYGTLEHMCGVLDRIAEEQIAEDEVNRS